jgi:hypothetical protein
MLASIKLILARKYLVDLYIFEKTLELGMRTEAMVIGIVLWILVIPAKLIIRKGISFQPSSLNQLSL